MSDVVPSFFPTPHEIAGGLRWVREHPVVATAAAAAATAVSVITFLRASTLLNDDEASEAVADLTAAMMDAAPFDDDPDAMPEPRERFATWTDHYPHALKTDPLDEKDSAPHLAPRRIQSHQDFTPHKLWKDAEDVYSNTDSDVSTASRLLSRRNSPASSSRLCDESSEDSPRGVDIPPTCIEGECYDPEDDPDTASPQWGWYVSTTPPEEQYS